MLKEQKPIVVMAAVFTLLAGAAAVQTAIAQKAAPKDKVALGEPEVRDLILLMDTDKNGKVSRQLQVAKPPVGK